MPNATIMDFRGLIAIYYSYQHPIALVSQGQLVMREDYWTRRRGVRTSKHIPAILIDVQIRTSSLSVSSKGIILKGRDFFVKLREEFDYHGVGFMSVDPDFVEEYKTEKKRRIRL